MWLYPAKQYDACRWRYDMQQISRAGFLRGDWTGRHQATPLPWSISAPHFFDKCIACDDCINACPQSIIEKGRGGYPQLNFLENSCTFCGECAQVCEHGAFNLPATTMEPALLHAEVRENCLAYKNIMCSTCGEACEADAIGFQPAVRRVPQPVVDTTACTGCGECFRYCPVQAIRISRTPIRQGIKPTGDQQP
jgi:ferredoxin-type protein NapF